ncbi:hypothetical protein [Candidatus Deferrimicrobium sp.]|uniref:hypothetical protein n=1 Tax=Candidatus Deferrimicrobium sp. TaxID=3060586 RepID=UPI002ED23D3B
MRPCKLFFPALAAGLLLSLVAGASLAAGLPDGYVPSAANNATGTVPLATDNATGAIPSATDNATRAVPSATDNATGAVPSATDNNWVDRTHSLVERNLFGVVVWFDHFFGDQRMVITERPEYFLRSTNELRWDEEERFSARTTIRASLRLPRLKKRWKLVISGETRGNPNALVQEDPGNPGQDVTSQVRTGATELVYEILRTPRSSLDVGAGARVKIPPDAFVRTRFQHARLVAFHTLGRFTGTAFWDARDGFGESNRVDFERWLALPTLLRWSNSFDISEKSNGWTWGTELSLLHKISLKSAITFAAGVSGSTRPAWIAQNYRVLGRYRRNVYRKWLFLEGEPFVRWPKKEDGSRKTVGGATLRVEILFSGVGPNPQDGGSGGP